MAVHGFRGGGVLPGDDEPPGGVHGHRGLVRVALEVVDDDHRAGRVALGVEALGVDVTAGLGGGVDPDGDRGAIGRAGIRGRDVVASEGADLAERSGERQQGPVLERPRGWAGGRRGQQGAALAAVPAAEASSRRVKNRRIMGDLRYVVKDTIISKRAGTP